MVYEMETGRTDFTGDWVSEDVAIRHRMTACIREQSVPPALTICNYILYLWVLYNSWPKRELFS
jgi:hypothetical protein